MNWTDEGIVLSARPHGETSLLVQLLTREHGRHAGLARGGRSSRTRAAYEPGARVEAQWTARLSEHLGNLRCELLHNPASALMDDAGRLGCLAAALAVAEASLPEREPVPRIYEGLSEVVRTLETGEDWPEAYVRWELLLLAELGFGLDLERCAVSGATTGLTHVSPKTGRAVSAEAAAPYREKLLELPAFFLPNPPPPAGEGRVGEGAVEDRPGREEQAARSPTPTLPRKRGREGSAGDTEPPYAAEVAAGLRLTGHFLLRHVWAERGEPAARARFVERATRSGGDQL